LAKIPGGLLRFALKFDISYKNVGIFLKTEAFMAEEIPIATEPI
jgi:hypothetical protein